MILDSSFLIDVQRGSRRALDVAMNIESANEPTRVPLVVIYELFMGVGKGTETEKNRRRVQQVLNRFSSVPATEPIMKCAGHLDGVVRRKFGGEIGTADAFIAATALWYDEPVVTADVTDFEKVPDPDLRVEAY
jgi:predicted nucleic acid-binding protein